MKTDTIVVPIDTFPTKVTANGGLSGANIDLYGGNLGATDSVWGTYHLTATEVRNGCTAQASTTLLSGMFKILATNALQVYASGGDGGVDLSWKDLNPALDQSYVIQRSDGNSGWHEIGEVANTALGEGGQPANFRFTDKLPMSGMNLYRIKVITASGTEFYSPTVSVGGFYQSRVDVCGRDVCEK